MSLPHEISGRAEVDLAHQYRWYLDNGGTEVAERYLTAFDATVARLVLHPHVGIARRFRAGELAGIRSLAIHLPFGAHLIFYRTESEKLRIERVLHGARDLPRRLIEPPEDITENDG